MNASSNSSTTTTATARQRRYLAALMTRGSIHRRVIISDGGALEQHLYLVIGHNPDGSEIQEDREVPAATFKQLVNNGWICVATTERTVIYSARVNKTYWRITEAGRRVIQPPADKQSVSKAISRLQAEAGWAQWDLERDSTDHLTERLARLERLLEEARKEVERYRNQQ